MQRRHLSAVLTVVAGLGLAGYLTGPARAATTLTRSGRRADRSQSEEHGNFWAGGTVTAVDASAGTVTITRLANDGAAETIRVAAGAAITVDKVSGTLARLPVGARALITGTAATDGTPARTATRIDAATSWPLRLAGAVVSTGYGRLTLNERDESIITVTVGSHVPVTLDGRAAALTTLPTGTRVWIEGTATATSHTVTKVTAATERRVSGSVHRTGVERRTTGWQ